MLAQDRLQGTIDQGRFPAAGHTGHADQRSKGKGDVHFLQIVPAGTFYRDELTVSLPAFGRDGDLCLPVQVGRSQRVYFQHILGRSFVNDLSSQAAGFRPHVDHIVGIQHHIFIVFHYDNRVSGIAQFLQRIDQADIIALVQSDTRLIQDIEHIDQLATYLGSQTDTLALSTGKACRRTVQREVIQSHIEQELQTRTDLFQYLGSNLYLFLVELRFHSVQPFIQFGDIHSRQFGNILAGNPVMQRFLVETLAVAFGTGSHFDELACPFLGGSRSLAFLLHQNVFGYPLVRKEVIGRTERFILDLQAFVRPVHDLVHRFFRNLLDWCLDRHTMLFTQGFDLPEDQ